jgi:hypothetical protein
VPDKNEQGAVAKARRSAQGLQSMVLGEALLSVGEGTLVAGDVGAKVHPVGNAAEGSDGADYGCFLDGESNREPCQ